MQYEQPRELVSEISSLPISPDLKVIRNTLDNTMLHVSGYYSPHDSVSKLAFVIQNATKREQLFDDLYGELEEDSLTYFIRNTAIKYEDPYVYYMLKMILIESFSLVYATENQPELFVYYKKTDADNLHNNINYTIDVLGKLNKTDYDNIIKLLREIDTNSMYLYSNNNTTTITQESQTNNIGHVNLVTDSAFSDVTRNWSIKPVGYRVEDKTIYNDNNNDLEIISAILPVYQGDVLSFSAITTGNLQMYATDKDGVLLPKFVDYFGNIIYNGVIAEANEVVNDVDKRYHGLNIPQGVNFVRLSIKISQQMIGTGYAKEPMITLGNVLGGYVE